MLRRDDRGAAPRICSGERWTTRTTPSYSEREQYYRALVAFPSDRTPLVRLFGDMQYLYWNSFKGLLPPNALIDGQYDPPDIDFDVFGSGMAQ